MLPQRSYNEKISRWGSYLCTMLYFAEKTVGKKLNEQDVEELYWKSINTKGYGGKYAMNANCRLNDPATVGTLALRVLGSDKMIVQIGAEVDGIRSWWGGFGSQFDYIAIEYVTPYGSHFVCDEYNPDESIPLLRVAKKVFYKVV